MQSAKKYQRFAARCLEEARATTNSGLKTLLAEMAQEWQRLYEETKGVRTEQKAGAPDPGD
jgi:hypothetical protein